MGTKKFSELPSGGNYNVSTDKLTGTRSGAITDYLFTIPDIWSFAAPSLGVFVDDPQFGVTGNGIADDRAGIQAAIDYAVLNGRGHVLFGNKTYRTGGPLYINGSVPPYGPANGSGQGGGIKLIGMGKHSTAIKTLQIADPGIPYGVIEMSPGRWNGGGIYGMTIDCVYSGSNQNVNQWGIYLVADRGDNGSGGFYYSDAGAWFAEFHDLAVINYRDGGVWMRGGRYNSGPRGSLEPHQWSLWFNVELIALGSFAGIDLRCTGQVNQLYWFGGQLSVIAAPTNKVGTSIYLGRDPDAGPIGGTDAPNRKPQGHIYHGITFQNREYGVNCGPAEDIKFIEPYIERVGKCFWFDITGFLPDGVNPRGNVTHEDYNITIEDFRVATSAGIYTGGTGVIFRTGQYVQIKVGAGVVGSTPDLYCDTSAGGFIDWCGEVIHLGSERGMEGDGTHTDYMNTIFATDSTAGTPRVGGKWRVGNNTTSLVSGLISSSGAQSQVNGIYSIHPLGKPFTFLVDGTPGTNYVDLLDTGNLILPGGLSTYRALPGETYEVILCDNTGTCKYHVYPLDTLPLTYAIANLPAAVPGLAGRRAFVSNGQTSPTFMGAVSTTGAVFASVFCNGTAWLYG